MKTLQINIINNSDDDRLHLALYQKPMGGPSSQMVAWRVASLSVGTTAYVPTPLCYAVQLRYQGDGLSYRSRCVPIPELRGAYRVTSEEGCVILNGPIDPPPDNRIVVTGDENLGQPVGVCITLNGDPVYGPTYINPTTMVSFGIMPNMFYLAKVEAGLVNGSYLEGTDLTAEVGIRPNQTATITGDKESGYSISVKEGLYSAECGC